MRRGPVLHCGGYGVERVGCEVGATVDHAQKRERFGEDEGMRPQQKGFKRFFDGVFERCLAGCILHDAPMRKYSISWLFSKSRVEQQDIYSLINYCDDRRNHTRSGES